MVPKTKIADFLSYLKRHASASASTVLETLGRFESSSLIYGCDRLRLDEIAQRLYIRCKSRSRSNRGVFAN